MAILQGKIWDPSSPVHVAEQMLVIPRVAWGGLMVPSPVRARQQCAREAESMFFKAATAASFAVLALVGATGPATAADLGYQEGSPYDDPRYADIYRHPPKRYSRNRDYDDDERRYGRRYADDDDDKYERYDDDDDDDDHFDRSRSRRGHRYACLPPWRIKSRLKTDGWENFQDLSRNGRTVLVRASRCDTGRTYLLRVDRCSGAIVSARLAHGRRYGSYRQRF